MGINRNPGGGVLWRIAASIIIAALVVCAGAALLRILQPLLMAVAFGIVCFVVLHALLPK